MMKTVDRKELQLDVGVPVIVVTAWGRALQFATPSRANNGAIVISVRVSDGRGG